MTAPHTTARRARADAPRRGGTDAPTCGRRPPSHPTGPGDRVGPRRPRPRLPHPAGRSGAGGAVPGPGVPGRPRVHLALRPRRAPSASSPISTSRPLGLDRLALFRHHHRLALPFLAPSFSRLRIDAEVAVCSSSGWAHGATVTGRKVVYCHTPARWLYQTDRYLAGSARWSAAALGLLAPPAPGLGPACGRLGRPVPGQLHRGAPAGGGAVRHHGRSGPPRGRRRPRRPGGRRGRAGAGVRGVRVEAPPVQERRGGGLGVRDVARPASGRGGHRSAVRTDRGRRPGQRVGARGGQRRPAAVALCQLGRAGGGVLRGLRAHPAGGGRLRQAHRRAPVGRIPRHDRGGSDRACSSTAPSRR